MRFMSVRIGGIASGMDTEQMIKDLMRIERTRVDKLLQQEQRLKWKQEAYNTINRSMANFILDSRKAFGLTTVSSTGALISSSVSSFNWVKKVTSSNENYIKATANTNAIAGSYTIEVQQLAEVGRTTSERLIDAGVLDDKHIFNQGGTFLLTTSQGSKEITLQAKLVGKEIKSFDFTDNPGGEPSTSNLIFSINGTEIRLDSNYADETALADAIRTQLNDPNIDITLNNGKLELTSKNDIHIEAIEGNLQAIGLSAGTTRVSSMDYLIKEINNSNLGVTAAYDKTLGRMMISTKNTGEDNFISVSGSLAESIFRDDDAILSPDGLKGQKAIIKFGTEIIESNTNNITVFGINLQLQGKTVEPITIRVETDVDSIYDKVKNFVDEYNKIIDDINGQINQKYYRDYPPLTDEQKQAMTEKDIELWEEKAKSGLLKGDSALVRALQSIRGYLYEKVENVAGSYNHITQIGITTGAYQDGGKLVIDEQKLKAAINNDPEGVMDLLFKSPASGLEGKEKMKDSGLVQRIYDGMIDGMKEVIRQSGPGEDASLLRSVRSNILIDFVTKQASISLLDKDLYSLNRKIYEEEDRLIRKEDRYWAQFSAMEKALQQMQSQSSWLTSQLGMGQR